MDGIALVVGSMAPDMAYVFNGSRFRVWAHGFPGVLLFCVPVTLVVAWCVARVISPVVWDHFPDLEPFHLHDYRGLAVHTFRWRWTVLSASLGALSHVLLDHFTHGWGWFAQNVSWYRHVLTEDFIVHPLTGFRIAQYAGHVIGTAMCIWMLARYGRARWMAPAATKVRAYPATTQTRAAIVGAIGLGAAIGGFWVLRDRSGMATDVMRVSALIFASLVGVCAALKVRAGAQAPCRG